MYLYLFKQICFAILISKPLALFSQDRMKEDHIPLNQKNAFCFTLLGTAGLYSFNYQREIISIKNFRTLADIGSAYYPRSINPKGVIIYQNWYPIALIENIRLHRLHAIMIGVGKTFIYDTYFSGWVTKSDLILGYRYQKVNKRFFGEVNYLLMAPHYSDLGLVNWGGLKVGYSF